MGAVSNQWALMRPRCQHHAVRHREAIECSPTGTAGSAIQLTGQSPTECAPMRAVARPPRQQVELPVDLASPWPRR